MGEQVEALEHHAKFGAHAGELAALLRKRLALDEDLAGIDGLQAVDGAAHGGFARARGTHHNQHLALMDGEVDVFKDVQVAVVLVHMAQLDDGFS